ncbi:heat-inducible transcriptional repressor HrcA [Pelotomaculum sp. PtaB.Bin117]|uniref:heat-inducible transcriptional repressor HrcA n=1 Tax=Pelotomaculum sp. PtaB.Bin117 TaxID=1811694 RepID=UPI0009D58B3B|nr:heat-inducible transcriptional repressor HrcA [Pelotomaculum sp. PtaB.Bin117]OPX87058.1 MAG: Heat-inducible transcription repressor HrcA [Pelotomaculum sp. PtaB.Bin117]
MDDRKQKVLLAIVHDYIATAEPVGSRTIAKKYRLGVSPATIRNEMADLEEQGFIEQPHTSAGRIPSERGYRYYVDFLMRKKELSREEENLIQREYQAKVRDVGQVIQKTGQLLSQLTNYTAMVLPPRVGISSFKHIQIVYMHQSQAMVIAVMDNGAVQHRLIEIPESITALDMETISKVLNAKLQGHAMKSIKMTLIKEIYSELSRHKHFLDLVMELVQESLTLEFEDKIYLGGIFNMLNQPEFHNVEKIKTMLSIMEQEKLLCDLLEVGAGDDGVTVRIGGEINQWDMKECSMITAPYSIQGRKMGFIGVLGPTRMEYAKVISVVDYMTKYLSKTLEQMIRGRRK